jgi:hypothetical protein
VPISRSVGIQGDARSRVPLLSYEISYIYYLACGDSCLSVFGILNTNAPRTGGCKSKCKYIRCYNICTTRPWIFESAVRFPAQTALDTNQENRISKGITRAYRARFTPHARRISFFPRVVFLVFGFACRLYPEACRCRCDKVNSNPSSKLVDSLEYFSLNSEYDAK